MKKLTLLEIIIVLFVTAWIPQREKSTLNAFIGHMLSPECILSKLKSLSEQEQESLVKSWIGKYTKLKSSLERVKKTLSCLDRSTRISLAKKCTRNDVGGTVKYFQHFGLDVSREADRAAVIEIASTPLFPPQHQLPCNARRRVRSTVSRQADCQGRIARCPGQIPPTREVVAFWPQASPWSSSWWSSPSSAF